MILVLDVGNTHVHIGLFTLGRLRATWRLASDLRRTDDEYAFLIHGVLGEDIHPEGSIISSVVPPLTSTLRDAVRKALHVDPTIMSASTELGIVNGYRHPQEVGMDRLANAVGGYYFHGAPLLVLDFGTAVTLDYLAPPEREGGKPVYKGGAILPGMRMSAASLARGASQLPNVDLVEPSRVIGGTTADSIRSGLVFGMMGAIAGIVERAREEIGMACRVVSTGGDAEWFRDRIPYLHDVQPDLTLYGLRQIYGINHGCPLPKP